MAAQIDDPARKRGYVLYRSWGAGWRTMPDEDLGSLLRAISLHADGLPVDMATIRPAARMAYAMVASTMDADAAKYNSVCEARREAGRMAHKGGKTGGKKTPPAPAPAEEVPSPKTPSPKKAPRPDETPLEHHLRVDLRMTAEERAQWQQWYAAYPRHVAARAGARAWRDAVRSGVPVERLQQGAEAYAAECKGRNPQYVAKPDNWLNGGRYDDEFERPGTPQPRRAANKAAACSGLDVFLGGDLLQPVEPEIPAIDVEEASHDADA